MTDVTEEEIAELRKIFEKFGQLVISQNFQKFVDKNIDLYRKGWRPRYIRGVLVWTPMKSKESDGKSSREFKEQKQKFEKEDKTN